MSEPRIRRRTSCLLDLVGNTPLVPITRLNPNPNVEIWAKIESMNPGGSVKDRIAKSMIEAAEASGELTRDKIILEPTSGNTGIGLAMVAAVKGYRILLAMSEGVSVERRRILSAFGAEILLTPAEASTDGAIEEAYRLARAHPDKYFLCDQFNNDSNWKAHYHATGPEIWEQTDGQITHFIATIGTTGTLVGTGRRLKELNPEIVVLGAEPDLGHKIQGLKNLAESYVPGIFTKEWLDGRVAVDDEPAYAMARRLAAEEGLLVGMSSGAAMHVAVETAKSLDHGMIVTILPDGGERYLSTSLFEVPVVEERGSRPVLWNSLGKKREVFKPTHEDRVSMYSCGPTVDGVVHIGVFRRLVVADLLKRHLEASGYAVEHVVNVTDLDDRTIGEARRTGWDLQQLTRHYGQVFFDDLDLLRLKRPTHMPRASEHIDDMIELTRTLVQRGYAYERMRSVYFDISKFGRYGRLSGIDPDSLKAGATIDVDDYAKDNPSDFALFKRANLAELKLGACLETEWGNVRPGWHIECAAMVNHFFGKSLDIHTCGTDLVFPHHENEAAICEAATGVTPARYWLHSAVVVADGKKMRRANGNVVTVRDLANQGFTWREIRYFLQSTHYRAKLTYTESALLTARRVIGKVDALIRKLVQLDLTDLTDLTPDNDAGAPQARSSVAGDALQDRARKAQEAFRHAIDDDLNISRAHAALFSFVRAVNQQLSAGTLTRQGADRSLEVFRAIDRVLGWLDVEGHIEIDAEIQATVHRRAQARAAHDFAEADRLRDVLEREGILVEDHALGTLWRRKVGDGETVSVEPADPSP